MGNNYSNIPDDLIMQEKLLIHTIKHVTNNQYIVITLDNNGFILSSIPYTMIIAKQTFGLSKFFTSKYIIIRGPRNDKTDKYIERLKDKLSFLNCEIYDELK